jgi:hypothetical protein
MQRLERRKNSDLGKAGHTLIDTNSEYLKCGWDLQSLAEKQKNIIIRLSLNKPK